MKPFTHVIPVSDALRLVREAARPIDARLYTGFSPHIAKGLEPVVENLGSDDLLHKIIVAHGLQEGKG